MSVISSEEMWWKDEMLLEIPLPSIPDWTDMMSPAKALSAFYRLFTTSTQPRWVETAAPLLVELTVRTARVPEALSTLLFQTTFSDPAIIIPPSLEVTNAGWDVILAYVGDEKADEDKAVSTMKTSIEKTFSKTIAPAIINEVLGHTRILRKNEACLWKDELDRHISEGKGAEVAAFIGFICLTLWRIISKKAKNVFAHINNKAAENFLSIYSCLIPPKLNLPLHFIKRLDLSFKANKGMKKRAMWLAVANEWEYRHMRNNFNIAAVFQASIVLQTAFQGMELLNLYSRALQILNLTPHEILKLTSDPRTLGAYHNLMFALATYSFDPQDRDIQLPVTRNEGIFWRHCRFFKKSCMSHFSAAHDPFMHWLLAMVLDDMIGLNPKQKIIGNYAMMPLQERELEVASALADILLVRSFENKMGVGDPSAGKDSYKAVLKRLGLDKTADVNLMDFKTKFNVRKAAIREVERATGRFLILEEQQILEQPTSVAASSLSNVSVSSSAIQTSGSIAHKPEDSEMHTIAAGDDCDGGSRFRNDPVDINELHISE